MPTKKDSTVSRKNLLGRNVTVQRKAMSDGSLLKTRTVTSKNGGTITAKNSFKDAGSLAGKMRAKKSENINKRQTKAVMKKLAKFAAPVMKSMIKEGSQEAGQEAAAKARQPRLKSSDKKEGHADAVRGGRRNAIKLNEARTEYKNHPYKYDVAKVEKAMATGRGGKVKRVMRRDLKSGRPF